MKKVKLHTVHEMYSVSGTNIFACQQNLYLQHATYSRKQSVK